MYCPDGYGCLVKCNYGVNQACQQTDIIQGGAKDSALSLLCNGPQACDQARYSCALLCCDVWRCIVWCGVIVWVMMMWRVVISVVVCSV